MCVPALASFLAWGGPGSAITATASGATAAAGGFLQTAGLLASVGGTVLQGIQTAKVERMNAQAVEDQKATEARLTGIEDERTRQRFRSEIRRQGAELIARGISLDSPTAVLLGQTAAQEMSFASQEVRSRGAARGQELSASERIYRARSASALLKGTLGAASEFLTGAPDVWPELLA